MFRLDYLSCLLTIASTILIGKRFWTGWLLAGANSVIICIIALKTSQFGFIPANIFCIFLYGMNVRNWRTELPPQEPEEQTGRELVSQS